MKLMEMFMLAAVDTKNRILYNYGTYASYGLSGIAVIELIKLGRLGFEEGKILVKDTSSTRDELLDEALQVISAKEAPKKLDHWITYLPYKVKKFDKRVMERLENNGILRIEQGRFLGLFPSRKYVVTNETERNRIVDVCRDALLKGNRSPEYEVMLIISIATACGFAVKFFTKDELKGMKETLKELGKGKYFEAGDDLTKQVAITAQRVIRATQAAVVSAGM